MADMPRSQDCSSDNDSSFEDIDLFPAADVAKPDDAMPSKPEANPKQLEAAKSAQQPLPNSDEEKLAKLRKIDEDDARIAVLLDSYFEDDNQQQGQEAARTATAEAVHQQIIALLGQGVRYNALPTALVQAAQKQQQQQQAQIKQQLQKHILQQQAQQQQQQQQQQKQQKKAKAQAEQETAATAQQQQEQQAQAQAPTQQQLQQPAQQPPPALPAMSVAEKARFLLQEAGMQVKDTNGSQQRMHSDMNKQPQVEQPMQQPQPTLSAKNAYVMLEAQYQETVMEQQKELMALLDSQQRMEPVQNAQPMPQLPSINPALAMQQVQLNQQALQQQMQILQLTSHLSQGTQSNENSQVLQQALEEGRKYLKQLQKKIDEKTKSMQQDEATPQKLLESKLEELAKVVADLQSQLDSQKNENIRITELTNAHENKLASLEQVAEKTRKDLWQKNRDKHSPIFPCKQLRVLPEQRQKKELIGCRYPDDYRDVFPHFKVRVEAGNLHPVRLCAPTKGGNTRWDVTSIERDDGERVEIAKTGDEVWMTAMDVKDRRKEKYYVLLQGDILVTKVTDENMAICKEYFMEDLSEEDWKLKDELKMMIDKAREMKEEEADEESDKKTAVDKNKVIRNKNVDNEGIAIFLSIIYITFLGFLLSFTL